MLTRRVLPIVFGLAIVLALTLLRISDPFPVAVLREIAFDFYQRLEPRPPGEFPVRVVDIDEASLAEIGQWPWPRDRLALITTRLTELGAAAIGFDVLFPEADRMSPSRIAASLQGVDVASLPDYDAGFAAALDAAPSILGFSQVPSGRPLGGKPKSVFAVSGPDPTNSIPYITGAAAPLPELRDSAKGLAALSLNPTLTTSAVRRIPMVWSNGSDIYPSLSIETLRIALGIETMLVFGDTAAEGYVDSVRVGQFSVPTLSNGDLWLYYTEPRADLYVSAKDLLAPSYQQLADRVAGHIVLVGTSASGLLDLHGTTLGDNVPGVSIHAQAIEQILSQKFLTRPDWVEGLEWLGFLAFGALLVLVVLQLGPIAGLAIGTAAFATAIAFSWWMFRTHGIMLDPSFPLVGLMLTYAALVFFRFMTTDADKRQIRRAFGYYVAPSLLTEIEKNGDRLKLGGELRQVTIMFTDVRGFTPLSEKLQPAQILSLLNTLFGALGAEIVGKLGTIDKFIGDAIMAFWNAPVDVAEHPRRAMEAALGMRGKLRALNEGDAFHLRSGGVGRDEVVIGIGISTGEALVGNMGLETRFDYSALGDTVNVASRVESACKEMGYDILVTNETRDAAPDLAYLDAGSLQLKGKSQRLRIQLLVGDGELAATGTFKLLRATHGEALQALRDGADATGAIAECLVLATQVEPGLKGFYSKLAERREDFAPVQAAA